MTIKELAEFTGRTTRTIRTWIKKADLKGCEETSQGCAIDYNIDDVEQILRAGSMARDNVDILMSNARQPKEITALPMNNSIEMIKMLSDIMSQSLATALKPIYDRLDNVETKQPKQLSLPSAPDIKPRALLRQLVNDYACSINISHQESWSELYKQFYYRCNESIKTKARNLKIIPLDYLEQENKLLTACSIMKDLLKG